MISILDCASACPVRGHQEGNRISALTQEIGCLAHDLRAVEGSRVTPDLETLVSGLKREIKVRLAGMGDLADYFVGGRIGHFDRFAADGIAPFAVDEKLYVGIGLHGGPLSF